MNSRRFTSLGLLAWCGFHLVAQESPAIRLDTVGYPPDAPKRATIAAPGQAFAIVRAADGTRVFEGTLSPPVANADTGEEVRTADFSKLTQPGVYRLNVAGVGQSPVFHVGADVYRQAFRTATRAMYLWRCGTAVRGEHDGQTFAHGPCHLEDAWLDVVNGRHEHKAAAGGWHDAGDYNKYVVNAGVTVGVLFRAWEDFGPAIRSVSLDLPKSGGALPDFLAELKWEVDWLLTMQAEDGAVYHKLSTKNFGPFVLPELETTERYLTPVSSAATADFVAMLALAARHFRPYDATYAERCLEAARKSHAYLREHPANLNADLTGFRTGAYATRDDDDRLWAAAELWETTGEAGVLEELESRLRTANARVAPDFDWGSVGNLGALTYLASARSGRDAALLTPLRENLLATADEIVRASLSHGYARPLGNRYYWGCNGGVARQTVLLQAAFRASAKPAYRETALDALHHLFGRNLHGRSYVTGVGYRPPLHPHDRRSGGDEVEAPWPGYLVGGPNPKAMDWKDEQADYRSNEIAINWNAALIYALAAFLDAAPTLPSTALETGKRPDVVYVPTPQMVVDRMLELARIQPDDVLYDLGCGDGRIVVTAARRYGIRAVGFDIDPRRVKESLENVRAQGVEHLVSIRQQDIFTVDLSQASVVTLYLLPQLNVRLMPQLARMRPGSRILSHDFDMEGAKPTHIERLMVEGESATAGEEIPSNHTIYQWLVPWEAEPQKSKP